MFSARVSSYKDPIYIFPLFISCAYLHKVLSVAHIRNMSGFFTKLRLLMAHSTFLYSFEERPYVSPGSPIIQLRRGMLGVHGFYDFIFCLISEFFCFVFALVKALAQVKQGILQRSFYLIKTVNKTFFDIYCNTAVFVGDRYHYVFSLDSLGVDDAFLMDSIVHVSDSFLDEVLQPNSDRVTHYSIERIPVGELSAYSNFLRIKRADNYIVVYARSVGA